MTRALFIIDVQNDFTEGGALGVDGGAAVASRITDLIAASGDTYQHIFASRDWHDSDNDNGGHFATGAPDFVDTWPAHCVADTEGAEYHPALDTSRVDVHVRKGQGKPAYSLFEGTTDSGESVETVLDALGVTDIDVVGIATDYCVRASALDAREFLDERAFGDARGSGDARGAGRTVRVLAHYIAGVAPESSERALEELQAAGVAVVPVPLSSETSATLTPAPDTSAPDTSAPESE